MAVLPKFGNPYGDESAFDESLVILDAPKVAQPDKTWAMQLDGDHCIGTVDGINAVVQTIFCVLSTEQGAYLIYPRGYGIKRDDLWDKQAPYVFAVLKDRIREALMKDERIKDVTDFSYTFKGDTMVINFTVHVNFTDTEIKGAYYVR